MVTPHCSASTGAGNRPDAGVPPGPNAKGIAEICLAAFLVTGTQRRADDVHFEPAPFGLMQTLACVEYGY